METKVCVDCGERYSIRDGRYYKYEPNTWLCDGCWDERMEE